MQHATFEGMSAAYAALKGHVRCTVSNLFVDSHALCEILERKHCLQYVTPHALFLLVPAHGMYYDCFYLAKDAHALAESLTELLASYQKTLPIRSSIIGKEPLAGEISHLFKATGFELIKKLLRMKLAKPEAKILDAMRPYAEEYREHMAFANAEDAEEILEILKENFDTVGDNLPEIEDIQKRIAQKEVVVLRQDGTIASLHYFAIQHGTLHSFYDVTRKEYRGGNGFFMAIAFFVHEHFLAQTKRCTRVLGWRDAAKQKLIKHAKKSNQQPDDIVIYTMLWMPGTTQATQTEMCP